MWWCQIINWLKFDPQPSSLGKRKMAYRHEYKPLAIHLKGPQQKLPVQEQQIMFNLLQSLITTRNSIVSFRPFNFTFGKFKMLCILKEVIKFVTHCNLSERKMWNPIDNKRIELQYWTGSDV